MRMMTARMIAQTRRIRSDEAGQAKASGLGEDGREPTVPGGLALPYNDNARGSDAQDDATGASRTDRSARMQDRDDAGLPAPSPSEASSPPSQSRRRGPLVTRWIGVAAQRRQARDRADRLRDRGVRDGSASSDD
jgi:hypothetical protein